MEINGDSSSFTVMSRLSTGQPATVAVRVTVLAPSRVLLFRPVSGSGAEVAPVGMTM
jgi:hypothetical protein